MSDEAPRKLATVGVASRRHSIAALCVAAVCVGWIPLSIYIRWPFNIYKQHRIMSVASVVGLILAFAAYRQPHSGHVLKHVALVASLLALTAGLLIVPL